MSTQLDELGESLRNAALIMSGVGRKKGSLTPGSFGHNLSKLEVGECLLFPYNQHNSSNIFNEVKRYKDNNVETDFEIKTCLAFECDLKGNPFKLIKVKRI